MMWDASTGQLARRYDDVTPTPITAICLDDRERKLLVADHAGNILVLNYQSGAIMKKMVRHHGQISSLLYIPERRYVVATSWDRTVTLQDESEQDEGKLLKSMPSGHACDVTTAAFSTRTRCSRRVATTAGSRSGGLTSAPSRIRTTSSGGTRTASPRSPSSSRGRSWPRPIRRAPCASGPPRSRSLRCATASCCR